MTLRLPLARAALVGLALLAFHAHQAAAQATTGNIAGSVRAVGGRPLGVEATVTATSAVDGRSRTARTRSDGTFRMTQLPPGGYVLEVTADGFEARRIANIQVGIGRTIEVPVTLIAAPAARAAAAPPKAWIDLQPGVPIVREVGGGPAQAFGVDLRTGELAEVLVDPAGAFVVRVYDPANRRVVAVERPARDSRTHLLLLARTPGTYRLDVHALTPRERKTTCRVTVASVRRAAARDEATLAALHRLWWAGQLRAQRTPAALREALGEYEAALRSWRELGDADGEAFALEQMAEVYDALGDAAKAEELRRSRSQ